MLLGYLSLGATIQVLANVGASAFGVAPYALGAVITSASLATAAARPIAGRRGDRASPRTVALIGTVLGAAGATGHLLASDPGALVAGRLVLGAGEGALFTGAIAWVVRDADEARQGTIVGRFGLSMWSGLAAGPPIGALVLELLGPDAVFAAAVGANLTAAALLRTTPRPCGRRAGGGRLLPPAALRPGIALGLAAFGYGTLAAFVVVHLRAEQIDGSTVALGVFGIAFVLVRFLGSRLVDDLGPRSIAVGAITVEAVGLLALSISTTTLAVMGSLLLLGGGVGLVFPATAVWVVDAAPARERGAAIGAMTSLWDLGIAAAGPVGAALVTATDYRPAFAAAAAACAPAALLAVASAPRRATPATRDKG